MMPPSADALTILKEYGLAGVMAWLFWWTLRRTMASHDSTVGQLKEQLDSQSQATRAAADSFARLVENHMAHVCDAIGRFDACLGQHRQEERRWQDRVLDTLERIAGRLGADRSSS